ncbi:MAG: riboflavin biosynthesis protein RibF [Ignavibacteriae bacterium]|nr:riboflavin biosynthesis protein RibF [Ignavibacteriota bacterium]
MQVYNDKSNFKIAESVLTIGTFDGLHLGHQQIISKVIKVAEEKKLTSVVVTFDPHPRAVVSKDYNMQLLATLDEKKILFEELKIDNLFVINFTMEFAKISSDDFVKNYLIDKLNAKHVVIGYDHKFGKNRNGDKSTLKEFGIKYGFDVTCMDEFQSEGDTISSTVIRNLLQTGEVDTANSYLGRNYSFFGKVVEGAKRGREIGFPTANIEIDNPYKLVPANGVYIVKASLDNQSLYGIMNIGIRPTFENENNKVIEMHIFDFNKNIYGKEIKIEFIKRIRSEKKFNSKEELINQITKDKNFAEEFLSKLIN